MHSKWHGLIDETISTIISIRSDGLMKVDISSSEMEVIMEKGPLKTQTAFKPDELCLSILNEDGEVNQTREVGLGSSKHLGTFVNQ